MLTHIVPLTIIAVGLLPAVTLLTVKGWRAAVTWWRYASWRRRATRRRARLQLPKQPKQNRRRTDLRVVR